MSSNNGYDPLIHDPASVDNIPIEVPLEWREPPSLEEEIKRYIRVEMSRLAEERGQESFEEANDLEFSDDDDFAPSANELTEDQEMAMMALARSSRVNGDGDERASVGASGEGGGKGSVDVGGEVSRASDGSNGEVKSKSGVSSGSGVSEKSA